MHRFIAAVIACAAVTTAAVTLPSATPDYSLPPGAFNSAVTQATIRSTVCVHGWTKTVRPPTSYTSALKLKQMKARHLPGAPTDYELDHFIPLALGGAPADPSNLWPEPWPQAHAKDFAEVHLQRAVCAGTITLAQAQAQIANPANWHKTINPYKEQYPMPNLSVVAALWKRIQVLASSALTYLTAISAALVALAQQLNGIAGVPEWATRLLASAIAVIAAATFQVRRVTPVAVADQGLLPPKGPAAQAAAPPTAQAAGDVGEVGLGVLFLVVALVCFAVFALIAHGTFTSDEGFTWLGAGLVSSTLAKLVP